MDTILSGPCRMSYGSRVLFVCLQSVGLLRSRIADQLMNELDPPDHHETILRIKELQAAKADKVLF